MTIHEHFHEYKRLIYYFLLRTVRLIPNFFSRNKAHKFLFILTPPYCGSTLLNQLLSTSNQLSCNNYLGVREGQLLPKVKQIMFTDNRWDDTISEYPWKFIKTTWLKYWDLRKPILLDKSVTNIMRVSAINKAFSNAHFIAMVRNPYAQAEGIIRRNNASAEYAAKFALKCLRYQMQNKELEDCNIMFISYEELCDNKEGVIDKIMRFVPELESINADASFTSHNFKTKGKMKIQNLNDEKIKKLSHEDLKVINFYFKKEIELLNYFNYPIIE